MEDWGSREDIGKITCDNEHTFNSKQIYTIEAWFTNKVADIISKINWTENFVPRT